jgi:hypothetical protein
MSFAAPNKFVQDAGYGILTYSLTGDGGFQFWWIFDPIMTYEQSNDDFFRWLTGNDVFGTSGFVIHGIAKPVDRMTEDQAIKRGFDHWFKTNPASDLLPEIPDNEEFYIKYNWIKQ